MQITKDVYSINGHIVLPEVMAPDADLAKSLIRAGRAAEVQAEIERREWLRSAEGRTYLKSIEIVPLTDEQRAECDAAAERKRAEESARKARRNARLRAKYPQHADRFL